MNQFFSFKTLQLTLFAALLSMALLGCKDDNDDNGGPTGPQATQYEEKVLRGANNTPVRLDITVDDFGAGTGTITWVKTRVVEGVQVPVHYILEGFVFVNDGQILTIEPGVVVKGKSGQGENASALVVSRGGKIFAEGTPTEPIIFTSEIDNLNGNIGMTTRGLWGGVIILGKATLNSAPGETAIEGIPTSERRGLYGGDNDDDNSGVFRYVSLRHGGTNIGANNEINGLTLGGVGRGTVIEDIEILANNDDGIEFFGGTVNVKRLLVVNCDDDGVDYDEGYRGRIQFVTVIQSNDVGDWCAEQDGGTDPEDGQPYAIPAIANATYVSNNINTSNLTGRMMIFRDNAGGKYYNSIFVGGRMGVDIEDLPSGQDSRARLDAGDLVIKNNVWYGQSKLFPDAQTYTGDHLSANNNVVLSTSPLTSLTGVLNFAPSAAVTLSPITLSDPFFETVNYVGAVAPTGTPYFSWTRTYNELFR
jgi:hypothetical protein